ncbi:hypothetical protein VTK56DRAFT_4067 [Thermocarpiscus australiensis]
MSLKRQTDPRSTIDVSGGSNFLWRCFGNQTEGANSLTSGKWFETTPDDRGTFQNITELNVNDASNPPATDSPMAWDPDTESLVLGTQGLSVWDRACTGVNWTSFSTSFYRAAEHLRQNATPVDAMPCWRPGAVPLRIQNVSHWQEHGCSKGFLCANNTVNSLPQYCPPFAECQLSRLGTWPCVVNGTNVGMGVFEPIICQAGRTSKCGLAGFATAVAGGYKQGHTADFGLSFGHSQLTFQPKGATRPILQNMTGVIRSGALTAVMGGSGAGKSTFINVLMGKAAYTSGTVVVNGRPGKLARCKKLIGYVSQDDIVLPELTVYESILHSARIRLPRTLKDADVLAHVDAVIDCLELTHVKDSMVGSVGKPIISGGQRKRVSIGMELAAAPMAIFLDEPTSGLDATAANSIMRTLKALARLGISVIVTIHQPRKEIFDMIDDLILLAEGHSASTSRRTPTRPTS